MLQIVLRPVMQADSVTQEGIMLGGHLIRAEPQSSGRRFKTQVHTVRATAGAFLSIMVCELTIVTISAFALEKVVAHLGAVL